MLYRWMPFVVIVVGLSACAHGFDRVAMKSQIRDFLPLSEDGGSSLPKDSRHPLTVPFRLAVAPPVDCYGGGWSEMELKEIRSWGERLKEAGTIRDLLIIPRMFFQDQRADGRERGMTHIRNMAARFDADAVLLIASYSEVDSYVNPLSLLNITLLGLWIVPAHHRDSLTIVEGVLVGTRDAAIPIVAEGEGVGKIMRSYMYVESADAIRASRVDGLRKFGEEFCKRVCEHKW